ncbi:hypothetical protein [Streptomyces sp. NPDC005407]|uniref:hypothetical protein n=1 Tax=Streptomyces sp. NPDC005407 TaxID=3155340 RepID=UPI0033A0EB82
MRRSHELVQLARAVPASAAQQPISEVRPPVLFEDWAHAASLIPISLWPVLGFPRRNYQAKGWNGPTVGPTAVDHVRAVITDRGAVTISGLGGPGERPDDWPLSAPVVDLFDPELVDMETSQHEFEAAWLRARHQEEGL